MREKAANSVIGLMGISFAELSLDRVVLEMPVVSKVLQPAGILHGGVSVLLAETAASIASELNIDQTRYAAVGLEINANHLRPKTDGRLTAEATPLHRGRKTMVWDIRIADEAGKLVCISRCTVAIVEKP
ncbi:hotdog fold thioesterase [Paenibacillus sp. MWE-103]|uniref:Hotdog fold thioesterase n=2 Tax=Paenibacillus artemisiicola TaxID=1172618 RepID=A0ABS3WFC8_9BACL|nr:hotdog fold thioesterase [Paenibacillus artemisiicola]